MTNYVHLLLVSTALLTFALNDLAFNSTPSSVEIRLRMHYILAIIHRIVNKLCPTPRRPRPAPQLQTTSDAPGAPGLPSAKSGPDGCSLFGMVRTTVPDRGDPLEFRDETYPTKPRGMGLPYGET